MKMLNNIKKFSIKKENQLQTIPVRDLKDFLIKDFEQIRCDEIEIANLKERVEQLEKTEIKYKATLITLEEYEKRISREKEKSRKLEDKIDGLKEDNKKLEEAKNNCIIREKQAIAKIEDCKDVILNDYKEELIKTIKDTKGNLSKKNICEIIKETFSKDLYVGKRDV